MFTWKHVNVIGDGRFVRAQKSSPYSIRSYVANVRRSTEAGHLLRSKFVQCFALLRVFYTLLVYVKHRITHATLPTVKYHSRIVRNELFLISNATVSVSNETVKFIATLHTGNCTR